MNQNLIKKKSVANTKQNIQKIFTETGGIIKKVLF
jgi:hypothetical protein